MKNLSDDTKIVNINNNFINELYINEPYPIFEFSLYHVLSYLSIDVNIVGIKTKFGSAIFLKKKNDHMLFTPKINNVILFKEWIDKYSINKIINVSKNWIDRYSEELNFEIVPRSKAEAVYDVNLLSKLDGGNFIKLRQVKKKLLENNLIRFVKVDKYNLKDAYDVLDCWQKTQGVKYKKNKYLKEKFLYYKMLNLTQYYPDLSFEIGYINSKPLSVCIIHKVDWKKQWGIIYLIKGINRKKDGGVHGVSDATYLHLIKSAKDWNLKFLNDGELGFEKGTREHKLRFQPINFLASYDLIKKQKVCCNKI